MENSR